MKVTNPRTMACVMFESANITYILPRNIVKDIVPIEKTAIFLKLKGLIIGRQKYQAETLPIINLQSETALTFSDFYHKLLVLHLIHPYQTGALFGAILIDKDPNYLMISEDEIVSAVQDNINNVGAPVMVGSKLAVIPDLKYLAAELIKEI